MALSSLNETTADFFTFAVTLHFLVYSKLVLYPFLQSSLVSRWESGRIASIHGGGGGNFLWGGGGGVCVAWGGGGKWMRATYLPAC